MNVKIQYIVTAISILMVCVGSSPAATRTWKNNTTGNWFTAANWNEGAVPVAGDDVVITNTGAYVLLSGSTETNLGSLTLSKTLVFTNWDSALNATNVTILTNGTMKLPAAFTNEAMSNNVYIICSNLTIETGSSINGDAKGYAGGYSSAAGAKGHGPGGGAAGASASGAAAGGGGYGGDGVIGWGTTASGGSPYGSSNMPAQPGSGGGARAGSSGGSGGGAIWINASGTVTVNGTITANGANAGGYNGGGSGGGVYIACNKLSGTSGVVRANGGIGGSGYGGGGGGGRIAVIYDQAAQSNEPIPGIQFSVSRGSGYRYGDIGTLYFPDSRLLTENFTHVGHWIMPTGITSCSLDSLTISNSWLRFAADGFQLTVTNDVTIMGSAGRFDLGVTSWTNWPIYGSVSGSSSSPVLQVGGNLTLTNNGSLYVYCGQTNTGTTNYGALVSVGENIFVETNCWIYPRSHETNGGSALFRMRDLFISTNGGFNANYLGFAGGRSSVSGSGAAGKGPGGGGAGTSSSGAGGGGGGYGGQGGRGSVSSTSGGSSYGSSNMPVEAGSGGGTRGLSYGGDGGGLVWINASGTVTINGMITANGTHAIGYNGGGSGGGIYITCKKLAGTNGVIRTNGGNGGGSYGGGGGGGRIAVWRVDDRTDGTLQASATGGAAGYAAGTNGTVVWEWIPSSGTMIQFF